MEKEKLSNMEKKVLLALKDNGGEATPEKIMETGMEMVKVMNASSWLQSKGLVNIKESISKKYSITDEGEKFLKNGLPEKNLLGRLMEGEKSFEELGLGKENMGIAVGWLKRKGWCEIEKRGGKKFLRLTDEGRKVSGEKSIEEKLLEALKEGKEGLDEKVLQILKRRGAVKEKESIVRTIYLTEDGKKIVENGLEIKDEIVQLTPEIIKSGIWKDKNFRKYDINAFSPPIYPGKHHPLTQLINKICRIFVEMGFSEIKGSYVESCFWDMDILFIPQDHPARDMQDTFYCNNPSEMKVDESLLEIIANVHETGGKTNSKGWGYQFSRQEAKRVILRTHTTVNTIRYLAENPEPPAKIFSIGKVFRRENIDMTHLPEFYQIEGIVYEEDANFCELIGLLKEFYKKMGFKKIRFRPAYFPYTEPSMEVEVKWNGKWMELGGSGIFRPEVTEPIGVKEPVLAWGLGLERIAMMVLGLYDIRDLYFSDIEWLRRLPLL
ncbi:MAG: phenylalanine--tRNA ligase subunit alpha [Candidatus Thermoplasmatota archaeon]|nr:phenylalanine--tRNA ligase subunit alpha [Candidatus Thermoplasmatota archaeon]